MAMRVPRSLKSVSRQEATSPDPFFDSGPFRSDGTHRGTRAAYAVVLVSASQFEELLLPLHNRVIFQRQHKTKTGMSQTNPALVANPTHRAMLPR